MIQTPLNRSRSDKFILILDLPVALKRKSDYIMEDNFKIDPVQISIFGSPVPAINIPAIDVAYGGQVYKTSSFSRPAYEPLSLKFLIDNGYKNYWTLWNWLNLLNDYKKSTSDAHTVDTPLDLTLKNKMSDYTSTFSIYGLDEYNNKIISFKYNHAFPISLSEIVYSDQDPNEITSNITFVFNQLEVNLEKNVNTSSC
jgi:hypothetical protein